MTQVEQIKQAATAKEWLTFVRPANRNDSPSTGFVYMHHWGTGHQELVFSSHKNAMEFASDRQAVYRPA